MSRPEDDSFQLPIAYVEHRELSQSLVEDLELCDSNAERKGGLYEEVLAPVTTYGKDMASAWARRYTRDEKFLRQSQLLFGRYDASMNIYDGPRLEAMRGVWADIKSDDEFIAKFHYVEYEFAQMLNESASFLQILTMYNLMSPVLSILLPIVFLILPFFMLQLQGVRISISKYLEVLRQVAGRHAIGQLFTLTSDISWEKRFYVLVSIGFYGFQIYQNFMCCVSFYRQMRLMHRHIFDIKDYIDYSMAKMDEFLLASHDLGTYASFNGNIKKHKQTLMDLRSNISNITPFSHDMSKLLQIGSTMHIFYTLHKNEDYDRAMRFSMSFIGYVDNICSIHRLRAEKRINWCSFGQKPTKFKGAYYPLLTGKPVRNSYDLRRQMIITGPNAAGKTTLLKTTTINIILSQQWGCGFYRKCSISPYSHIHCYLNIPDTSGRDSLFQAEARRCKEILDAIVESGPGERHFCIFDELYSGTNPYEAVASSYSFLDYLTKQRNTTFMLTTHFVDLCEKLEKNFSIRNCHMKIDLDGGEFRYRYKLSSGISVVKGGIKILENLHYPEFIISKASQAMQE